MLTAASVDLSLSNFGLLRSAWSSRRREKTCCDRGLHRGHDLSVESRKLSKRFFFLLHNRIQINEKDHSEMGRQGAWSLVKEVISSSFPKHVVQGSVSRWSMMAQVEKSAVLSTISFSGSNIVKWSNGTSIKNGS